MSNIKIQIKKKTDSTDQSEFHKPTFFVSLQRISSAPDLTPIIQNSVPRENINTYRRRYITPTSNTMPRRSTIKEAFESSKSPATPQFVSPPIFDPCFHDAETFLRSYDRCAIANGWDENLKITYFGTFLSGIANRWYENYVENNTSSTWRDIVLEFKVEFPLKPNKDAEFEFANRKQFNSESIREYFYKLKLLAYDVDPLMDDSQFIKYFERGLHPKFYTNYQLSKHDCTTIYDLTTIIDKLEKIDKNTSTSINELRPKTPFSPNGYVNTRSPPFPPSNPNFRPRHPFAPPNQNFQHRHPSSFSTPSSNTNRFSRFTLPRNFTNMQYSSNFQNPNRSQNFSRNQNQYLPVTRTNNGRPRCYNCNRIGHFANTCRLQQHSPPNDQGRQNF